MPFPHDSALVDDREKIVIKAGLIFMRLILQFAWRGLSRPKIVAESLPFQVIEDVGLNAMGPLMRGNSETRRFGDVAISSM